MNGIIRFEPDLYSKTQQKIIQSKSKIIIIQTNAHPCNQEITSKGPSLMWNISSSSGGEVFVISTTNTDTIMKTIPFQYKSSKITNKITFSDCSKKQTFKFPVDSETKSVNVLINGNLRRNPVYNGTQGENSNFYNDYSSNTRLDQILPDKCKNDWQFIHEKCWGSFFALATWEKVKAICSSMTSALPSIFNQNDQDFITGYANGHTIPLGLNDIEETGKFVWDSYGNSTKPISSYTNWGQNQPNLENGSCVYLIGGKNSMKWEVHDCNNMETLYMCVKDVHDQISPEVWTINLETYEGSCSVEISAQTNIQIFPSYVQNLHSDKGSSTPILGNSTNYVIVHLSEPNVSSHGSARLQSVTFTSSDNTSFILPMHLRDSHSCQYQYISDGFQCSEGNYEATFTGMDSNDNKFQQIHPTFCSTHPLK